MVIGDAVPFGRVVCFQQGPHVPPLPFQTEVQIFFQAIVLIPLPETLLAFVVSRLLAFREVPEVLVVPSGGFQGIP
jgi:hypothetical protein